MCALPLKAKVIALIFALFVTRKRKLPRKSVVVRLVTSAWSKPCRKSTGSASEIDTDTPFPEATGFSSPKGQIEPALAVELTDALEQVLDSSTNDGLCSTPPIGPPKVALTSDEVARGRPFLHIASPDVISGVVLLSEMALLILDQRCCFEIGGTIGTSEVSCLDVVDCEVTKRSNRIALSLVCASFPTLRVEECFDFGVFELRSSETNAIRRI